MNARVDEKETGMHNKVILWGCLILLAAAALSYGEGQRSVIGVQLDPAPLPELLTKHLRLDAGQGVRISNVTVESAADKVGLQRDDIIIAFQGEKVTASQQLAEAVGRLNTGTEVLLEIIHLGERETLDFALTPMPKDGKLKYPPEPGNVTSWRPGKVFKIGPEGQEWIEIPFNEFPDTAFNVKEFFKEFHTYEHSTDDEDFTITIEGDPNDDDSRIIVRAGDTEYSSTVGEIDALPEKYRSLAEEDLADARTSVSYRMGIKQFHLPEPPAPDLWRQYFDNIRVPQPDLDHLSETKDRALKELREQMEQLQQRMGEMEKRNREMLDKLLEKKDKSTAPAEQTQQELPSESQHALTV
jgi:hypothetical protein